jgi:hypothetical protein
MTITQIIQLIMALLAAAQQIWGIAKPAHVAGRALNPQETQAVHDVVQKVLP